MLDVDVGGGSMLAILRKSEADVGLNWKSKIC